MCATVMIAVILAIHRIHTRHLNHPINMIYWDGMTSTWEKYNTWLLSDHPQVRRQYLATVRTISPTLTRVVFYPSPAGPAAAEETTVVVVEDKTEVQDKTVVVVVEVKPAAGTTAPATVEEEPTTQAPEEEEGTTVESELSELACFY